MAITRGRRWLVRGAAVPLITGLILAACSTEPDRNAGPGVTSAPCPQAVHKDTGCIYLGVLSALGGGPYAVLGKSLQEGQIAFWNEVNKAGGIDGYEVDITKYARDTEYEPRKHAEQYTQIEPNVLALAMSLGTSQTLSVLPRMDAANMIAAAGTLWSGWQYRDTDMNLVFDGSYSYCTEAILGLDWFTKNHYQPHNLAIVAFRGNYGADYANGVLKWAGENGSRVDTRIDTGPNSEVGNQSRAVTEILSKPTDLVALATGPVETAEIVGALTAAGYTGRFLGSAATWNGALLQTPVAHQLSALYNYTSPVDGWDGVSKGAQHARAAAPREPTNWGYNLGWAVSYPMKAALTAAAARGGFNRAALRRTMDDLTVDSEGMASVTTYGGPGPNLAAQQAVVNTPDPDAPLGSRTLDPTYHGATLEKITLTGPCAAL
ncbi:ABC transporter substrate-binding protein [Nocardia bovistercoris]|uniref:ABC transporter substrate-binding protein n=1 Tax=Nocardia bovistercoris TaxID=2785916 RepID=A0A931I670_9NOCA|nr:ABC transporter substrate-binding protein [Nocardia bovistercoris]MBH0775604.1 ABC transporter substrate-binding protein [Nocardia bovistercoris]